ncbi:MAG: ribonuclease D, partial [Verrucomicrobiota bacterium]
MTSEIPERFASFPERYIETQESFESFVAEILSAGELESCSIDTEADSMHSYETKLCLIQFSTPKELAIIDPLAIGRDGLGKFPGFIDQFQKVWMHGADYDISMFSLTFDWAPHRIMDTQIAARLLGETKFGLANLLENEYRIKVSKQSQKADWSKRPLSQKMLEYAFNDVRYLLDLAEKFELRLKEAGRYEWFLQSCDAARDNVFERSDRVQRDAWRVTGWG